MTTIFFKKYFIYFFRERGKEGEREGEKHQCVMHGCLLQAPNRGPGPQPGHVPWLGIKLVTFQFAGWCSIHWATPARVTIFFYLCYFLLGGHTFSVLLVVLLPSLLPPSFLIIPTEIEALCESEAIETNAKDLSWKHFIQMILCPDSQFFSFAC